MNGTFQWTPELQELIQKLQGRLGYTLDFPLGYSPEERELILNQAISGVDLGERTRQEALTSRLAGTGALGTGFEAPERAAIGRETSQQKAGIRKGVALGELQNRIANLASTSNIAGSLISRLFETEQIPEILSAGRRGEGARAIDQMLNYLGMMMGGQEVC